MSLTVPFLNYMEMMLNRVNLLLSRVTLNILGIKMSIRTFWDMEAEPWEDNKKEPRVFIQIVYKAFDSNGNGVYKEWRGRKWYLSKHMTDDEIIKTAYAAFEAAVKHEVLEGFKVDGITIFNPHVDFEELIKISHKEVKREDVKKSENLLELQNFLLTSQVTDPHSSSSSFYGYIKIEHGKLVGIGEERGRDGGWLTPSRKITFDHLKYLDEWPNLQAKARRYLEKEVNQNEKLAKQNDSSGNRADT